MFILFLSELLLGRLADVDNGHHRFLQTLNGAEFVGAVEVEPACKDVGAGQSLEGALVAPSCRI